MDCNVKGCKSPQYCRGLCRPCYEAARRRILTGETSWAELETLGMANRATRQNKLVKTLVAARKRKRRSLKSK